MLFTTPITRFSYLLGKFCAVLLILQAIYLVGFLSYGVGIHMWWMDDFRRGATGVAPWINAWLTFIFPTVFVGSAVYFALGSLTRNSMIVHAQGLVFVIGALIARAMAKGIGGQELASLVGPFGVQALSTLTEYWTIAEKTEQLIPFSGEVLYNRLIWMGIGVVSLVGTLAAFRMRVPNASGRGRIQRRRPQTGGYEPLAKAVRVLTVAPVTGTVSMIRRFLFLLGYYMKGIVKGPTFWITSGLVFFLMAAFLKSDQFELGVYTWPMTYLITQQILVFSVFLPIIITVYAGKTVSAEKDMGLAQLLGTLPVPRMLRYGAKMTSVLLGLALFLSLLILEGAILQATTGYYNVELGLYVDQIFIRSFWWQAQFCLLFFAVHMVVPSQMIANLLNLGVYVVFVFWTSYGRVHPLLGFAYPYPTEMIYSAMNGVSPFTLRNFWMGFYWFSFSALMFGFAYLFSDRHDTSGLKQRFSQFKQRLKTRPAIAYFSSTGAAFLLGASMVFYNVNVVNSYSSEEEGEQSLLFYENEFKPWSKAPQPKITNTFLEYDIYPDEIKVDVKGYYDFVNPHQVAIDSIVVDYPAGHEIHDFSFSVQADSLRFVPDSGIMLWRLPQPLAPGDSARFNFSMTRDWDGFFARGYITDIAENGTFRSQTSLPKFGYARYAVLQNDNDRKRLGLDPYVRAFDIDDSLHHANNMITSYADWTTLETIISTSDDQTAIAPGKLIRSWEEDGRRYFHYKPDAPVLHFFSFQSGRYEVARDTWNDVDLEIYHHPGHEWNVDRMMRSMKESLDYMTSNFGPYEYRVLRVVEFPRYRAFAQSYATTIPYSESAGFISKPMDPNPNDLPFYVTAHEVAHQWWGHQVVGADVQGSAVLSEALAEYSALMIAKRYYPEESIPIFLRHELDQYLEGRSDETRYETPLFRTENQKYVNYNKGALAMYVLQAYVGEETVNNALRSFLAEHRYATRPYPTSRDLVRHLKAGVHESVHGLIDDYFMHITIHELEAVKTEIEPLENGEYKLRIGFTAAKYRADGEGNQEEVPVDDIYHFAAYERVDGKEVVMQEGFYKITPDIGWVEMIVPRYPTAVGVDPNNYLIDLEPDNNKISVSGQASSVGGGIE